MCFNLINVQNPIYKTLTLLSIYVLLLKSYLDFPTDMLVFYCCIPKYHKFSSSSNTHLPSLLLYVKSWAELVLFRVSQSCKVGMLHSFGVLEITKLLVEFSFVQM